MLKITGYPDRYSVEPGERIEFKVSLEEGNSFEARLVRVIHGDANPRGRDSSSDMSQAKRTAAIQGLRSRSTLEVS